MSVPYRVHCTKFERGPSGEDQLVRRTLDVNVGNFLPPKLDAELAAIVTQVYPGMQVASYERIGNLHA